MIVFTNNNEVIDILNKTNGRQIIIEREKKNEISQLLYGPPFHSLYSKQVISLKWKHIMIIVILLSSNNFNRLPLN